MGILRNLDNAKWLEVLRLFSTTEGLHVGGEFATLTGPVLDGLTREMVAEVSPALRFLNLSGRPTRSVRQFISASARRLSVTLVAP
jgi:hypothetical protein